MQVQEFFADYSQAYNDKDIERMVERYSVPAIIIQEHKRWVLTERGDIRDHVQRRIDEYQQQGVEQVTLELMQMIKLAEEFAFCNMLWRFFDKQGKLVLTCPVSYTLQMRGTDVRHIVSVVKDKDQHAVG